VELLMAFHPEARGRYMIHCHNLTHEDHDMMTQFRVGPENKDGKATFTDGAAFTTGTDPYVFVKDGEQKVCDTDDPVLAAHPCSDKDV
jgi:heme/copper-type cytochrome/quinol oxidase subunit 2